MAEVSQARRDRAPLTRARIVRAALALIDERGLGQLTMRRLGADLGVEAMSLYKHVPGKEAILDGVRELLLQEFAATPLAVEDEAGGWREHLARFANAYRAVGLAHPEAFGLLAPGARAGVRGGARDRRGRPGAAHRVGARPPDGHPGAAHDRALRAGVQPGRPAPPRTPGRRRRPTSSARSIGTSRWWES